MKPVLIVDDHAIVRGGIIRLLCEISDYPLFFDEASTAHQALEKLSDNDYSLVLLDISLPGRNGLDLLKQIHQVKPDLPVLVLSMYSDEQYAVRALRSGAVGYVTKGSLPEELKDAVEQALQGKRYVTSLQANLLVEAISETHDRENPHKLLSDREYQFASMMTAGKTMTEIARELSLSVKTVSVYRTRVLEKLKLKTNAEIISYCLTHGVKM